MIRADRQPLCSFESSDKTKILPNFFNFGKFFPLLSSHIHEERLLALLILVRQYQPGSAAIQEHIVKAYLANLEYVNNWDLVDSSAPNILGANLMSGTMLRYAIERFPERKRQIYLKGSRW